MTINSQPVDIITILVVIILIVGIIYLVRRL